MSRLVSSQFVSHSIVGNYYGKKDWNSGMDYGIFTYSRYNQFIVSSSLFCPFHSVRPQKRPFREGKATSYIKNVSVESC